MTQVTVDLGKVKFNWRGTYDAASAYTPDDVVEFGGSAYVCIIATTGLAPSANNPVWDLMAQGGDPASIMTTQGDLLVKGASGLERLPIGTSGQALQVNSAGNGLEFVDAGYRQGEMIERLIGHCDGRSQTILSGTYTFPNVTGAFNFTTSFQDFPGSLIAYTPPAGATRVVYEFHAKLKATGYSGLSHYKFFIDSNEVVDRRTSRNWTYSGSNQGNAKQSFYLVIDCNASAANANNASFTSWTAPKQIKMQAREYNSSYQMQAHTNTWWNGAGASGGNALDRPELIITSYA